ncbi:Fur family transcriptional regulator [Mycobacterium sp. 141]|uniref:Fur family transcriptional regulator n=1 Tax=Mycobacterium sp. 141 TaxID=1120797 RepID=UPI00036F9CB5|nr:transcriptional repressor [Mycobacterium sp. 141]
MTAAFPPRQRRTANKQAVLDALGSADTFRSAQHLFLQLHRRQPQRIALTSVYRILHSLAAEGVVETQSAEDGEALYRLRTGTEHRHYLLCRQCGRAVPFSPTALEEVAADLVRQHHFTEVTHRVDLYGTCPRCHSADRA